MPGFDDSCPCLLQHVVRDAVNPAGTWADVETCPKTWCVFETQRRCDTGTSYAPGRCRHCVVYSEFGEKDVREFVVTLYMGKGKDYPHTSAPQQHYLQGIMSSNVVPPFIHGTASTMPSWQGYFSGIF
jgi:hypothetical protein